MEATPAESKTHIIARSDGGGTRPSGDAGSSVAGPRAVRTGVTRETYSKEDWLPLASADPAFWLKGAGSLGLETAHRKWHPSARSPQEADSYR